MGGENMNSLTKAQQELVAQNLPVVHWVICDYIHVNPTICGLEYSDLFQEGCLWLCKAAATYKDDGRAQFSTYAKTVVKTVSYPTVERYAITGAISAVLSLASMASWRQTVRRWNRRPMILMLVCPW